MKKMSQNVIAFIAALSIMCSVIAVPQNTFDRTDELIGVTSPLNESPEDTPNRP